ncbi:MAG: hypothetical protein ACREFA_02480 [Stellaceae bacterium]
MHDVVASLAFAAAARCEGRPPTRAEKRQQRALRELAESLALVFPFQNDEKIIAEAAPLVEVLMRAADRCERHGLAHTALLPLPEPYPFPRWRIDPPSLCLAAVMRLRIALEKVVARAPGPRRIEQLKIVLDLEAGLRDMARGRARRSASMAALVKRVDEFFWAAEQAIGDEGPEIFRQAEDISEEPRVLQ